MPLRIIKITRNEVISLCLGELLGLAMAVGMIYVGFNLTKMAPVEVTEVIVIMGDGSAECSIKVRSETMPLLEKMGLDAWFEACSKMREEQ